MRRDTPAVPTKLLDQVRARMRRRDMARRTEVAYVAWIRRFILANGKQHPLNLGKTELEQFLTDLAVRDGVSSSTQNQALSALLFLYREVLLVDLPWLDNIARPKRPVHVPVVMTAAEVALVLGEMSGVHWLAAALL